MTDTVQNPVTENTTGNEGATASQEAQTAKPEGQPAGETAPQSNGANDTSANPNDKNTPNSGDGKVADADKDNTADTKSDEEGGDKGQNSGFDVAKLKLPEGITATDEQREAFKKDVESLGINSQEGAQKFLDWVLEKAKGAQSSLAKQQENDIGGLETKWTEEGKKDPVLGKDYDKNVADALETAGKVFSPRTIEFLKDTRFTKNPDFLKDMLRLAKERADAELIMGQSSSNTTKVQRDNQGRPMLTFK